MVLALAASAGAAQLPLRHYTTADGLASNAIYRITRDPRGFLWFATQQGLSRFDGYAFSNQTTATGLPHNIVSSVLIDRRGNYWLGTGAGLARFHPDRAQGSPDRISVLLPNGSPATVTALLEDRTGRIWCGTSTGLFVIDPAAAAPALAEVPLPDAAGRFPVGGLAEDRDGALWIGMEDGTLYRRLAGGGVEHYGPREGLPGLPHKEITDLLVDRKGRFWVGTEAGLYHAARPPRPGAKVFEPVRGKGARLPQWRVFTLFESREGDVWASLFQCLVQFPSTGAPMRVWGTGDGLPDSILSMAQDRDGNLWMGTNDLGALKLAAGGFLTYSKSDGVASDNVSSIAETRRGELYATGRLAAGGMRVSVRSGEHFLPLMPRVPAGIRYFGWRPGRFLLQDREGEWWLASFRGLIRYPRLENPADLAGAAPRKVYTMRDGLPDNQVIRLYEDRRGNIWMSTYHRGATCWDRSAGRFHRVAPEDAEAASSFCEDRAGNLWFGDDGGQLWRVSEGCATRITGRSRRGWINDMLVDHAGRLWVATAVKGLMRFDHPEAPAPEFREYALANGLSSMNTRSLLEDADGSIYVGTGDGVDRLEPDLEHFRHYSSVEGLAPGQVHAAYRDRAGALWFGTSHGLARMAPEAAPRRAAPAIWITGLSLGGRPLPVSDVGEPSVQHLLVQPNQQQLQFDFVGLSFAAGNVLRYQYRLGDASWSAPILSRSVHYGALPAGSYRFEVRAINSDGQASPRPAAVEFRVVPPVWRRGWFEALLFAASLACALWVHRARVSRLLAVERVRTRIATDLHDDVGSTLSQIAILSEVAQQRASRGDVGEVLQRIGGLSREMLDSIGDIVWAIQPDKDRLSDLKHRMRRFAADVLSARNIGLHWSVADPEREVDLDTELRRQIYLIFKESIRNITRHSQATEAWIGLRVIDRRLLLEVRDNGCGIERSEDNGGNGLKSMQLRAARLGGELEVHSAEGSGTTVRLRAPLPAQVVPRGPFNGKVRK